MPWESSNRRQDPPGWKALRLKVIERAQAQCQAHQELPHPSLGDRTISVRCSLPGTDVDHILNLAQGGTDDLSNLQLLCQWHHKEKTQREAKANRPRRTERHPGEAHPGLIN